MDTQNIVVPRQNSIIIYVTIIMTFNDIVRYHANNFCYT